MAGALLFVTVVIYLQVFSPVHVVGHQQEFEETFNQNAIDCIDDYISLETVVLNDTSNVYHLQEAFFPTNRQMSVVVDVQYCFPNHNNNYCLKFRWIESAINLYIRPEWLMFLSLMTYQVDSRRITINIEKPLCENINTRMPTKTTESDPYTMCTDNVTVLESLLNNFTTNLRSYTLHGTSVLSQETASSVSLDKEKGYTAFFFNDSESTCSTAKSQSMTGINTCVLHFANNFKIQRALLHVAQIVLTIFLAISIPLCLVVLYDTICEELTDSKMLQYFVWASIVASFVLNIIIVCFDLAGIIMEGKKVFNCNYKFTDVKIYFGIYTAMLFLMLLSDISFAGIGVFYTKRRRQRRNAIEGSTRPEFPIPSLVQFIASKIPFPCCLCIRVRTTNNKRCPVCSKYGMQFVGAISLAYFFKLLAFHSAYIIMGIIAAPVEAGSISWFYISVILCFVAFIAVVLKATDKDFQSECKCTLRYCGEFLMYCIVPVLIVFFFLAFAVTFIAFIYLYTLLVQVYTSSKGVMSFIGAILPSVTFTALGYVGTRIVRYIKSKRTQNDNRQQSLTEGNDTCEPDSEQTGTHESQRVNQQVTETSALLQHQSDDSDDTHTQHWQVDVPITVTVHPTC